MPTMKLIQPVVITTEMFSYCNVTQPAPGEVLWDPTAVYAVGDEVIRTETHRVYKRVVAGTTSTPPENDLVSVSTTNHWQDYGSTQQWAMFDNKIGSLTSTQGDLVIVLTPGQISGIALLEVTGRSARVVMKDQPDGTVVYDTTVDLDETVVGSVYDFLFKDHALKTDFVLTDLPEYFVGCEVTITISSTSTASVGVLQVGKVIEIGDTEYGASVGINDYSKKEPDEFGDIDVQEGSYSKEGTLSVEIDRTDFNRLYRIFAALRATPCVFICVDAEGFEPFLIFGFYKSFTITVQYFSTYLCALEIEGLNT